MSKSSDKYRDVMLDEVEVVGKDKSKKPELDLGIVETQPVDFGRINREVSPIAQPPTSGKTEAASTEVRTEPETPKVRQARRNPFEGFGEGLAKVASVLDFNRDARGARAYDRANERIANREHRAAVRRQKDEARADARDARQAERQAVRQARAEDRAEAMAERQAVRQNRIDERAAADAMREAERAEREAATLARRQERAADRQLHNEQKEALRVERAEDRAEARSLRAEERLDKREQRNDAAAARRDARIANKAVREEERNSRIAEREAEREKKQAEHAEAVQMRREARGLERAAKELERSEHRDARIADKEARREERQAGRDSRKQERADRYTDKQRERMFDDVFGAELDGKSDKMPKSAVHKDVPIIDSTLEEEEALPKPTPRELKMAGIPQGVQTEAYKDKIDEDVPMYVPTPERAKKAQEYAKNIKMAGIDVDEDAKKAPELDDKIEPIPSSLSKWDSVLPEVVVDGKRTKQPTKEEDDARRKAYASKLQSIVDPYLMGSQATEETIKKGHSIYDIEKENQAKREQEKIDEYTDAQRERILREAFKEDGKKAAAPVVDENVPVIDSTLENEEPLPVPEKKEGADKAATVSQRTEQEGAGIDPSQWEVASKDGVSGTVRNDRAQAVKTAAEPQSADGESGTESSQASTSEPDWYSEYVKSLYSEDDRIADEKKKKAAQWIVAAQMLGDSIGALSNVYWTGKGANAMKFEPGAAKAAAAAYNLDQDIRNAREKATKAKMDATLAKYKQEWEEQKHKDSLAMQNRQLDQQQRHWQATYDAERQDATNEHALKNSQLELQKTIATNNANKDAAANALAVKKYNLDAMKYSDAKKDVPFYFDGQLMSMPYTFATDKGIANIYGLIPEEYRRKYEGSTTGGEYSLDGGTTRRVKPDAETMMAAVSEYSHIPEVANALRELSTDKNADGSKKYGRLTEEEIEAQRGKKDNPTSSGKKPNPMG